MLPGGNIHCAHKAKMSAGMAMPARAIAGGMRQNRLVSASFKGGSQGKLVRDRANKATVYLVGN
ncbi:hypothetical protein GCM10027277_19430 [Pseudoduganella ginsengisoli]